VNDVDNDWTAEETGPVAEQVRLAILSRRLPRAELHTHLSGAFRPSLIGRIDRNRGPDAVLDYVDVGTFFERHDEISRLITSPEQMTAATIHVLSGAVDSGCRHVEIAINRTEFTSDAGELAVLLDAMGEGFREVRDRLGVTGGIIVGTDRDSDIPLGIETVELADDARHRGVPILGIGNDGLPSQSLLAFAPVYDRARALGLRTTAHANKPQDVVDVLELGLDRIDHAWELQGQSALQRRVTESGTPVTMALSSCFIMLPGRFPTPESFPFDELRRAGVVVTLNVDDAAMFFTDSAQEYRLAAETYGYDAATLAEIALASLEAAWIDDDRERRLAAWRVEAMALVDDPRNPQIGAVTA
jgi:adenosine deaminase